MTEQEKQSWGQSARKWWVALNGLPSKDGRRPPADKAAAARLRRMTVAEAMSEEATFRLLRRLGCAPGRLPRVAALACVLAHVRDDAREPFGRQIGRTSFDDTGSAKLKPLRFQRLMAASGGEEIATAFRRAVAILDGKTDVAGVADIILGFDDERVRRRLIFDYYAAGERVESADTATLASSAHG